MDLELSGALHSPQSLTSRTRGDPVWCQRDSTCQMSRVVWGPWTQSGRFVCDDGRRVTGTFIRHHAGEPRNVALQKKLLCLKLVGRIDGVLSYNFGADQCAGRTQCTPAVLTNQRRANLSCHMQSFSCGQTRAPHEPSRRENEREYGPSLTLHGTMHSSE